MDRRELFGLVGSAVCRGVCVGNKEPIQEDKDLILAKRLVRALKNSPKGYWKEDPLFIVKEVMQRPICGFFRVKRSVDFTNNEQIALFSIVDESKEDVSRISDWSGAKEHYLRVTSFRIRDHTYKLVPKNVDIIHTKGVKTSIHFTAELRQV